MKALLRLIQPKKWVGKLTGALVAAVSIPELGSVLELDATLVLLVTVGVVAGYLMGWSMEQIKQFIEFLAGLAKSQNKPAAPESPAAKLNAKPKSKK